MKIKMHTSEACSIVNNLVFRPGWKWSAEPAGDGVVSVTVDIRTEDTNYPPDYRVPIDTGQHDIEIDVSKMDADGLLFEIKTKIIEFINDHEDREFLRRGDIPGYPAPFHPHHLEGEARWLLCQLEKAGLA
jgi:hypothetical protein